MVVYTWEQLATHNTEKDCYIAVRGKVYDVSSFMAAHPGGSSQLLLGAGRDATQVFESYHKTETISFAKKFYVGDLVSNELPTFPEQSAFQKTLRDRVGKYFSSTKQDPKWAPWMFVRYFFIISFMCGGYALQLRYGATNFSFAAVGAFLMGLCGALIGLMPMHDSSHFSITHNPTVWKLLGAVHDLFNGASFRVWEYQHMLGHHPYTNIDEADPDIMTASKEVADVRRIKKTQAWFPRYCMQNWYVPVLYSLLSLKTRIQDITITFLLKRNGSIRLNPISVYDFSIFWLGKALFVYTRFIFPMQFMSTSQVLALFCIQDAVSSWWLALSFQSSHVVGEVEWPLPDKNNRITDDWAELQIRTTMDYATDSWFWTLVTGALNHQTTHHLFPGVCQYYYREITPIIAKTCKEFGVPYHYKPTFFQALGAHLNHLENLSVNDVDTKKKN